MNAKARFALWLSLLTLFALALVGLVGGVVWSGLDGPQRDVLRTALQARLALLVILALLLPFVLGALLRWAMAAYPLAAARMAQELALVNGVNPEHRVSGGGAPAMRRLGDAVNALAETHGRLRKQVQARVDEANARLAEEKNRLAALMSELTHSVIVCNSDGRILLYNERAARLLEGDAAPAAGAPVGLGRSIFGVLDKSQIVHALDKIGRRLEQQVAQPVAHFATTRGEQLLRVQLAPVLDLQGEVGGFVLLLEDITRSLESDNRRERLLRQLTEGTRASLANLRAAVETVQEYPDMDPEQRRRFTQVIRDEAEQMSSRLDATLAADADASRAPWPLEEMLASEFVYALRRSFERGLHVTAAQRDSGEPLWVSVDSHALVQALTQLMGRIVAAFAIRAVVIETAAAAGHFVRLSLCWSGPPIEHDLLREWAELSSAPDTEAPGPTLEQLLQRHGAEVWSQADRASGLNRVCLQMPSARPAPEPARTVRAIASRPVYYDFDLFSPRGQSPEFDEQPLGELVYTVFDTETTGLSPADGDEIIAIGAVRIVNGRLLKQECFDRFVKPRRHVRREAQQVHGISGEMLAGEPGIEQVLPMFHRFAEDTVLVAHNAAFDMRFLQGAQARTGIEFAQPVLDTLMLSALAHPGQPDTEHRLEEVAARLGVPIIGRHTALGDAIVAGEVFLKLIPLLAERGIHTLAQAREASQTTPFARLAS